MSSKEQVKDYLENLVAFKFTELNGMHTRVPKELAKVILKLLTMLSENSWRVHVISDDEKSKYSLFIFTD